MSNRKFFQFLIILIVAVAAVFIVAPRVNADQATLSTDQVCSDLTYPKTDTTGNPATVTVTAKDGYLIDYYCVKAGNNNPASNGGTYYVTVVPPREVVEIDHPTKDSVSNYSYREIPKPTPTPTETSASPTPTETSASPTPTETPSETPTPTDTPTETPTATETPTVSPTPEASETPTAVPSKEPTSDFDKAIAKANKNAPTASPTTTEELTELPKTGPSDVSLWLLFLGLGMLACGITTKLLATRR